MNRLVTIIAVTCGIALFSAVVKAETVEELKHELAVRKAYISKLERRVHELEKRPSRITAPVAAIPARPSGLAPPSPPEDAEMERALERTLVREGALVLAPWSYELTPQFSFAHWDKVQDPTIRNSYSAGLGFRMGLPWQSQVSVWLPYVYSEGKDGFPSSSGLGDAGIVFSKELMQDNGVFPNLVGSIGWTSPTSLGGNLKPIPYVSGFQAGFTASKSLDPLVVFLGASYFSSASRDVAGGKVNPADVVGARMGASLAVSPATSLTAGFNLAYLTNMSPSDFTVSNSDRVLSSFDVGISTIVWGRTMLNVTAQFGITGHVPDFRLIASLPVRF
jgi:hypothetical protein